jgi:hypothetical protein
MRVLVVFLLLVLGAPIAAAAQGSGSILPPDSKPGDRVTVTTTSGARLEGRLVTDGAGALVLRANDRERPIAHDEIGRVTRRHNRFLFGPLIGLGAGLAIGLPIKKRLDNEGADGDALLALFVAIGVGTGTAMDLANGSDRTIYARRPAPVSGLQVRALRGGATVGWRLAW